MPFKTKIYVPGKLYRSKRILGHGGVNQIGNMIDDYKGLMINNIVMFVGFQEYDSSGSNELWMKVLCKGKTFYHYVDLEDDDIDQWYEAVEEK